jgi:P4 family phage/plasmid primase-like protien
MDIVVRNNNLNIISYNNIDNKQCVDCFYLNNNIKIKKNFKKNFKILILNWRLKNLNKIKIEINNKINGGIGLIQNFLFVRLNNKMITTYSCYRYYSSSSNKKEKPNLIQLAQNLKKNKLNNYKFDLNSSCWFLYDENLGAWYRQSKLVIEQKIFIILIEEIGDKLTPHLSKDVLTSLEMLMGVDFYINNTKNIMARLVPFKNGVLDLNTIKLLNHDPSYYFTYSLNINYNPSAKIEKSMLDFLISITNNNLYALKIIRSFIKCLLIKDNQYQVALYLYGPGGTGKSTFEKVLTSLVGNKNATVLNLQDLNKQFALSKVVDKSLVLFSDVNFYTGDPSKLRLLISGDLMNAEIKYKDSFDIQPNCLVVLSSNMLWSPKDASTGLQRRIIYMPIINVPNKVDRNLFTYNLSTNEFAGTLARSIAGLVNWALANTEENINLMNNAVEVNKLIDPSSISSANPLVDWIQSSLSYEEGSEVLVGTKKSDPQTNLFPNYLNYCKDFGHKTLSLNNFSLLLVQQLNTLINESIKRVKTRNGLVLTNIKINEETTFDLNATQNLDTSNRFIEEFTGYLTEIPFQNGPMNETPRAAPQDEIDWSKIYTKAYK